MQFRFSNLINAFLPIMILFGIYTLVYAKDVRFHSPYFDITLNENLKLISKTEEKDNGFYRYIFGSSSDDDANLQMRVIVSSKTPKKGQSLEDFQTDAIANMIIMYMDSYQLYQYLDFPENKKILSQKPSKYKFGNTIFTGIILYLGEIEASFLVTNSHGMTYAFTLISKDTNEQTRKNNLEMLTKQLESIEMKAPK